MNSRMADLALRSRLEDDEDMGDFASGSKVLNNFLFLIFKFIFAALHSTMIVQ